MKPLSAADRRFLAVGLLLARYLGHRLRDNNLVPSDESVRRCYAALRLAKRLGVRDTYLELVLATPPLSVTAKSLEPPPKARKLRRYAKRPKVRPEAADGPDHGRSVPPLLGVRHRGAAGGRPGDVAGPAVRPGDDRA